MTAEAVPLAPAPEGWTIADVDALPENGLRYELVDGVPHVMNPPKKKHQRAAHRLRDLIERAAPAGVSVIEAVGVVLADDQRPVPDVVVLRDSGPDDDEESNFPAAQVMLVAEIVSPSSRSTDRFRKHAQYAQAGIAAYIRVELEYEPFVVAYRIGDDGLYTQVGHAYAGELLKLAVPFSISFDPAALLR